MLIPCYMTNGNKICQESFIVLFGADVYYKSKVQATVFKISTYLELIAYLYGSKSDKYITSILEGLGFKNEAHTTPYCDNMSSIMMDSFKIPIEISIHIYIRKCYLQEFIDIKQVDLYHTRTALNTSDESTKALVWALHSR